MRSRTMHRDGPSPSHSRSGSLRAIIFRHARDGTVVRRDACDLMIAGAKNDELKKEVEKCVQTNRAPNERGLPEPVCRPKAGKRESRTAAGIMMCRSTLSCRPDESDGKDYLVGIRRKLFHCVRRCCPASPAERFPK